MPLKKRLCTLPWCGHYGYARFKAGKPSVVKYYIRTVAARSICMAATLMHELLQRAAVDIISHEIPAMGGHGGAIALDAQGHIAMR